MATAARQSSASPDRLGERAFLRGSAHMGNGRPDDASGERPPKPPMPRVEAGSVPTELQDRRQWLVWKYTWDGKKWNKPPRTVSGRAASTTDPDTWSSFEEAHQAHLADKDLGIGFVFTETDPYLGIDLDHCVNENGMHEGAQAVVDAIPGYAEMSPSGTGVHVIVRGKVQGRSSTTDTPWGGGFEHYDRGRYFTFTGQRCNEEAIGDRQSELDGEVAKLFTVNTLEGGSTRRDYNELRSEGENRGEQICAYAGHLRIEVERGVFNTDTALAMFLNYNDTMMDPPKDERTLAQVWRDYGPREGSQGDQNAPQTSLLSQQADLTDMIVNGVPPASFLPTPTLYGARVYDNEIFVISGQKKAGKTWAMWAIVMDVIQKERHVVYLDYENGMEICADRSTDLGAKDALPYVREFLHYVPFPAPMTIGGFHRDVESIAAQYPHCLIVIDSFSALFSSLIVEKGEVLKMNDAQSIQRVYGPLTPITRNHKVSIGVIDHSSKYGTEDDEHSTSHSARKGQVVDSEYFWTKVENFNRTDAGVVKLRATSDRRGHLPYECYWTVGGQGTNNPLQFEATTKTEVEDVRLAGPIREFMSEDELACSAEGTTMARIRDGVEGDNGAVTKAVKALAADDTQAVAIVETKRADQPRYRWSGND